MPNIQSQPFGAPTIMAQPVRASLIPSQPPTNLPQDRVDTTPIQKGKAKNQITLIPAQESSARAFLSDLSQGSFDPLRSTQDQLLNLKTSHDTVDQAAPSASPREIYYTLSEGEAPQVLTARIGLSSFTGVDNLSEMQAQLLADLATDPIVIAALGENPSPEALEAYLQENYLGIVQLLGNDLKYYYEGFVSLNGDVDAFSSLNERGGVCSDIAGAIAAFHKANGSESYIMMSTGNDYAHVINLFQRDGTWYIQNYQHIVPTEAQTLEELYDIVMPENREIKLWEVNDDGSLAQVSTEHLTATGRSERRFRNEAGVGAFSPWQTEEGVHIGTDRVSVYQKGFYAEADLQGGQGHLGYYRQTEQGAVNKIQGFALSGQYDTNAAGYQRSHLDGKYESEKRWVTEDSYGRAHFSVFSGVEGASAEPAYWGGDELRDPIGRVGVSYDRNASKVYGGGKVKFELGSETHLQAVLSSSLEDPTNFQTAGLIYSDLNAEQKLVTGVWIQPNQNLTVRTGLASGVDLDNIDGTDPITQMGNVMESNAYVDIRVDQGPVAANLIADIPLHQPTQYKVGAGLALSPLKNGAVVVGATYLQEQIVTDRVDRIQVGAQIHPTRSTVVGASLTTPLWGENTQDLSGEVNFQVKF